MGITYHSTRVIVGILTLGRFTSGGGLRVNSSLTISVFPSFAAQYKAVLSPSPLALMSNLPIWACTSATLPALAASWSALLSGIVATEISINQWHRRKLVGYNDQTRTADVNPHEEKSNWYLLRQSTSKQWRTASYSLPKTDFDCWNFAGKCLVEKMMFRHTKN